MLMVEGLMILSCLIPAFHFGDGTWRGITLSGLFTLNVGLLMLVRYHSARTMHDRRLSYLLVVLMWIVLALFGAIPFMATGVLTSFTDALFESMSGITSTGATVFGSVNKYSLYTAEASGADNTGKHTTSTASTVRQTLGVYILLTLLFVFLLCKSGMQLWDAVNITFTNISSGGFSIYNDSLSHLTHLQQYIVALAMLLSGVNFAMLYNLLTFHWDRLRHKLEQFRFYIGLYLVATVFVAIALSTHMGYSAADAARLSIVQTASVLTTTGSLVADTSYWWVPVTYLFVILSLCGGMAGSTTGGLKAMRVLILIRHVRKILRDRLHPHAVNPVRLNRTPVSSHLLTNVMVIFMVYVMVIFAGVMMLMLCGINATESIGAAIACITGYGPGLGISGGFGCYAHFTTAAKLICSLIMLLGRLECLTLLILFIPSFWRR